MKRFFSLFAVFGVLVVSFNNCSPGFLTQNASSSSAENQSTNTGMSSATTGTNLPASFSCNPSGALSSFSLSASVRVASNHKNTQGHYFVAGILSDGTKLTFANGVWKVFDGSPANTLSTYSEALDQFTTPIFNNSNLTDYPGAEIRIGYGLGSSKSQALENMLAQENQHKLCSTLPQNTPATFSCPGSGTFSSYSLLAQVQVDSRAKDKPGFYFVAAFLPSTNKWYLMDQDFQWKLYDESEDSISGIQSSSLNSYSVNLLSNSALNSTLAGAKFHIGYSTGSSKKAAFDNMLSTSQYQLCHTLPTQ